MQIYLIRHPQTRATAGLCYGRLDVEVDPEAAGCAAHAVRARIPAAVLATAPIYSSPLQRCATLAQALASPRTALPASELVEIDLGAWEGQRWDAIPRNELDAWARDLWCYRPGGGESAQSVLIRWLRWLGGLRESGSDAVIAVTHAGVIRVAMAQSGRRPLAKCMQAAIEFASVHRLTIRASGSKERQEAPA